VLHGNGRLHHRRLPLGRSCGGSARIADPPFVSLGSFAAFAVLAVAGLDGCSPPPSLRYEVVVGDATPRTVDVTAVVDGMLRDSVVLSGFAPARALRISGLSATDARGRALAVRMSVDSAASGEVAGPRFAIAGPLQPPLRVRWRVDPDVREGDDHVGYTGVRVGFLGERLGLVTGRGLFLVPQPASRFRDVRVKFRLPRSWQAYTPWRRTGDDWRTDLGGRFAAEHLIAASLGWGAFRERHFHVGRTTYDVAISDQVPDSVATSMMAVLQRTAGNVRELFGHDLGPHYRIVAAPVAPDGDEIHGEAWASGQGGTLAPLTALRLRDFTRSLVDAYLRHAPYRVEVASSDEYWLVDGISDWFAWHEVAAAGLADEGDVQRELAVSYLRSRHVEGVEHDLEQLYSTRLATQATREIDAPLVLAAMDRLIRRNSTDSLVSVVQAMFRSRPAASLWTALPGGEAAWRLFRERHVRGREPIRVASLFGVPPTRPLPDPPVNEPTRWLTLIITGDTYGFLEHCGCKANQSGGVARRATVISRLRRSDPGAVLIDAGNAFLRDEKIGQLDFLSREEQKLYLRAMAHDRYDAMAVGTTELTFGSDWYREAGRGISLPYVCANLKLGCDALAPPVRRVNAHGLRVAIVSALDPPRGPGASRRFEESAAALTIEDPVASLRLATESARDSVDLVMAIGRLSPATIRRAVAECPELDVVVSTDWDSPVSGDSVNAAAVERDQPGFLGRTLVLYADSENYGLESVRIGVSRDAHIATARTTHHLLFEDVPDDASVRAMIDRFYDQVGTIDSAQASVRPLFADSPARLHGDYVGTARCAGCHAAEATQWRTTAHANAYKTLLDAHRHYQPRCVVCHVVGFGTRTGFRLGSRDERLAGVQCEVCHGPGGDHVAHPGAGTIARAVPESTCLECHTPDHSDHFAYADRLPLVAHRRADVP
jgi:2',3'-cyclic-nucleotide 2'-phosphodiesterase (5'-nucleotidase family)